MHLTHVHTQDYLFIYHALILKTLLGAGGNLATFTGNLTTLLVVGRIFSHLSYLTVFYLSFLSDTYVIDYLINILFGVLATF